MSEHLGKWRELAAVLAVVLFIAAAHTTRNSSAWSNCGPSSSVTSPDYGTHDWIAHHALDWLPADEKQYIASNLQAYLYGTELPDFSDAVGGDGIGDTSRHHVYYRSWGGLQDDAEAQRAQAEFDEAVSLLKSGDIAEAAKAAGTMTHYIDDLAVFGHVMGANTDWGSEVHHQDYEDYVNAQTRSYGSPYNASLRFDGSLGDIRAYDAALRVAHDTTFDDSGHGHTAVWMDSNFDWSNPAFKSRMIESLNLAVNAVADALHSLWVRAQAPPSGYLDFVIQNILLIAASIAALAVVIAMAFLQKGRRHKRAGTAERASHRRRNRSR